MRTTMTGLVLGLWLHSCSEQSPQPPTAPEASSGTAVPVQDVSAPPSRPDELHRFVAEVDRAARAVRTATFDAQVSQGGVDLSFQVVTVRDSRLSPIAGKIMMQTSDLVMVYDGTALTAFAHDGRMLKELPLTDLSENPLFDLWVHFLVRSPFGDELIAPVLREEAAASEGGEECRVVYVEYARGSRARWHFAKSDKLPRRVERLYGDDEGGALVTRISNLVVNGPVPVGFIDPAARRLGHAYWLSWPFSGQDIRPYLEENKAWFIEGGACIRLARALGTALVREAYSSYDPDAYERAMGTGGPFELAADVAESITSGSVEMMALGKELLWLADVLPPATRGDLGPFTRTGTELRREIRRAWPQLEMLIQSQADIASEIRLLLNQMGPIMEEVIVLMARMLPE